MTVKRSIPYREGMYFITFTCHRWIPLIAIADAYDLFYKWFNYLVEQGHFVIGYQLMPNHAHFIFALRNTGKMINKIIGNGKRFLAYGIVHQLNARGQTALLGRLEEDVNDSDKLRSKLHEVWEDSFDWKECDSWGMTIRVLNYMHNNPCSGKWTLVDNPADYIHSSAKYYITGQQGQYPVTHFMKLADVDLTKPVNNST
jgi:hypothetical protein